LKAGESAQTGWQQRMVFNPETGFNEPVNDVPVAQWAPPENITQAQEDALRADLDSLKQHLEAGCDARWAMQQLTQIGGLTAYRSDVSHEQYRYKLKVMAREMSGYPADVVDAACQRYARENKWFPELADMVRYMNAEMQPLKDTKARIERCLHKRAHQKPRKAWRPPTQADKEHARELAAGFRAQVAELDEQERKANRARPSGIQPARRGLPEGPGSRAARNAAYEARSRDSDAEAAE
jgi:hypothetical protein